MNLQRFKACVASYMQRDAATFVDGSTNLITEAANMARRWAERQHNFEMSKTTAQITSVHYQNGALLSAMTLRGTSTLVDVKAIQKAFLPFNNGTGEFPVDVISREKHVARIQRHYQQQITTDPRSSAPGDMVAYFAVVRHGDLLYLTPADSVALGNTTITAYFDIVRWQADYAQDADHDLFLDYCPDFMLMQTVFMLNFMIKEDARMPVNEKLLEKTWTSVLTWDNNIIQNASEDANLD